MPSTRFKYISGSYYNKKAARLGGSFYLLRYTALCSHLRHPNRKSVHKNKDQNNTGKDEGEHNVLHNCLRFRQIIDVFGNESRVKHCKLIYFTTILCFSRFKDRSYAVQKRDQPTVSLSKKDPIPQLI